MRRSLEQSRHPNRSRGIAVRRGGRIAVVLAAAACNSVLGIREASLTCDDPSCASDMTSTDAPIGADPSAAEGVGRVPDAGMAPSASSNGSGASGTSNAGRDVPVAPIAPPSSGGSGGAASEGEQPAASSGGSGTEGNAEPPNGGASAGVGGAAGSAGNAGSPGAPPGAGAGPGPASCNAGDACSDCLCAECQEQLAACAATPGCLDIIACSRNSGCFGFACYCGSVDLITCATTDLADGPCVGIMLAAPESHPPSVADPNAGPASDAALAVANCSGQRCAAPCVP